MTDVKRSWFKEYETQAKEIAELKESIDMLKYVQNEKRIAANAIREMLAKAEPRVADNNSCYLSYRYMEEYADKLEKNK